MLPVTDPGENRRIQTALRQRRTEMVRETLIGRGGRDTATTVLPKTVRGGPKTGKHVADNSSGGTDLAELLRGRTKKQARSKHLERGPAMKRKVCE